MLFYSIYLIFYLVVTFHLIQFHLLIVSFLNLNERKRASVLPREGRTWCVTLRSQVRGLSRHLPSTNTFLAAAVFQAGCCDLL